MQQSNLHDYMSHLNSDQEWAVPLGNTYADLALAVGRHPELFVPPTPPVSDPYVADHKQVSAAMSQSAKLTRFQVVLVTKFQNARGKCETHSTYEHAFIRFGRLLKMNTIKV